MFSLLCGLFIAGLFDADCNDLHEAVFRRPSKLSARNGSLVRLRPDLYRRADASIEYGAVGGTRVLIELLVNSDILQYPTGSDPVVLGPSYDISGTECAYGGTRHPAPHRAGGCGGLQLLGTLLRDPTRCPVLSSRDVRY
eukprot:3069045-Rhodomonas_salina.1